MADLTVSSAVDAMMQAANETALRLSTGAKADTGWVPPESVGDKAFELINYTAPSFAGSDTIHEGKVTEMAAQVQSLTYKVQALETALAANLRPNP